MVSPNCLLHYITVMTNLTFLSKWVSRFADNINEKMAYMYLSFHFAATDDPLSHLDLRVELAVYTIQMLSQYNKYIHFLPDILS